MAELSLVVPLRLAAFPYPDGHHWVGRPGVLYAYALVRDGSTILYDTGIGFGNDWVDRTFQHHTRDVRSALREAHVEPTTVERIVHSHLHFDHCGQDRSFPGVPIVVQRVELEAARRPGYTVPEWVDFPGARYEQVVSDHELEPGVRILATPGHTAGHQSLAVETADGLVVLAGHAIFSAAEYRGEAAPAETSADGRASAERLRALRPAKVYFSHDDAVWTAPRDGGRSGLDPKIVDRLREVGLDPADPGDPAAAWRRLHERFGTRATLIDRYALEAAHRHVRPEELSVEDRRRLTMEVLTARTPGFEVVPASGRAAADPIEVVPYDPLWSAAFSEWREKLQRALGPVAGSIEHIGSTSVPGLAGKPVIDIQVTVRELEDEASYVPAIEALGVALRSREPGHRYFRPAGTRPRTVQIHVYPAGSAEARDHVLFREYLRANAHARDAYARMKSEVARLYRTDRIAYNEAKTGFILDELERAREWDRRRD